MAKKKRRPKMKTKEQLLEYLEANLETELPFNEEVWELAVEKTKDKERQFKVSTETDYEGNTKTKKIPNGATSPVGKYFQIIALPQYKKTEESKPVDGSGETLEEMDIDELLDSSDEGENSFIKELVSIYFSTVVGGDLEFVIERLSDYYTNYEFNEGADKFLVVSAMSDELALRYLYSERVRGRDNEPKIEKIRKSYLSALDGLKLLKKQTGNVDDGKNKFTMYVDELEKAGELKFELSKVEDDIVGETVASMRRAIVEVMSNG